MHSCLGSCLLLWQLELWLRSQRQAGSGNNTPPLRCLHLGALSRLSCYHLLLVVLRAPAHVFLAVEVAQWAKADISLRKAPEYGPLT